MSNVQNVIDLTNEASTAAANGTDGTWGPDAEKTTGYYVGGVVPSLIMEGVSNVWGQNQSIRAMVEGALKRGNNIGVWTDTETDKVYFDESQWIGDLDLAKLVAKCRGEIAIWDIANSCEIRIPA